MRTDRAMMIGAAILGISMILSSVIDSYGYVISSTIITCGEGYDEEEMIGPISTPYISL